MKSRIVTGAVVLAGLLLAGAVLGWVGRRPAVMASGARAAGVGVLGGWRTLAADLVWLRAHASWEKREAPATEALLELTTALDPRPLYFWLNGARIMAYDLPAWRIAAAGGFAVVPASQQAQIDTEQAQRALRYLAAGRGAHPTSAALWIEQANIELNRLHDVSAAAESYRLAADQPDAPYYAARIHAELLRKLGRKREALDWLTRLYPRLPPDDEAAADLVASRIQELERELKDDRLGDEGKLRGSRATKRPKND